MPPNICVSTTHTGEDTLRHNTLSTLATSVQTLHTQRHPPTQANMSCTHIQTTYLCYIPSSPGSKSLHRLCALHLCSLCQPRPTSHPAPCCPSPGLLSCRMMARKKSWENMALTPCPSCSTLPPHIPFQPSQLGSQPGAGLQRKAHPAPFSPGQSVCQARSSSAWSSQGRGQDHHTREPPWGGDGMTKRGS